MEMMLNIWTLLRHKSNLKAIYQKKSSYLQKMVGLRSKVLRIFAASEYDIIKIMDQCDVLWLGKAIKAFVD